MYQSKRENIVIIILIFIIITAAANLLYKNLFNKTKDIITIEAKQKVNSKQINYSSNKKNNDLAKVIVHIGGEVINPGVYQCKKNSRIYTVLKKAGGPSNKADLNAINLANRVRDGQKIIVPTLLETSQSKQNSKVNINTASQSELEKISGVGPVTAKKIIEFRKENGLYQDVDSLTKVSGIGPKTLEKVKGDITY